MTQNPKIYRIDTTHRLLKGMKKVDSVIERIIATSFKKLGFKSTFQSNGLSKISKDNINYYLYVYNSDEIVSDWKEFLPNQLTIGENFIHQKLSLILFIETEFDIFCVIGGDAYRIILPYIDHSYGLNTYARIMKPEKDELASIKSRGITGSRAGLSEQFRDNYKIIDYIKFGKIPQEIHLILSQEISDLHFNFLQKKKGERIQIFVGKAFKIKKDVDFNDLHKIIIELCHISGLVASDYLSSYKEITDKEFIKENLQPELARKLFNDTEFIGRDNPYSYQRFNFDFCNPNNIEKFYEADKYRLKEKTDKDGYTTFKIVSDRKDIYEAVLRRAVERFGVNNSFSIKVFLQGVRITCLKNDKQTIGSSFLFHISTEFNIKGKPVFLVDTKWYHLRDSFLKDLRINTLHILKTYSAPKNILDISWNKNLIKTEKEYNIRYDNRPNYIVVDTVIADGLELCDIIYYDNDNLYLIHVKFGFNSKMRELSNQVNISARRLREALGTSEKSILGDIYNKLEMKGRYLNNLSKEEFKDLFNKKVSYILAFSSHLKEDWKVEENIDTFDSNIAKFSLIQCSGEMRANYYDLLVSQIRRE